MTSIPLVYQRSNKLEVGRIAGKLEQLIHAISRYQLSIMGLCEMCWKNLGEMSTDDGHNVYFSREEDRHGYGMGLDFLFLCIRTLQQADINPPESSSFQYHHYISLGTNIWS